MADFLTNSNGGQFHTTCWTQVLKARGDSEASREALGELCEDYYEPVMAYLKRSGFDRDGNARDLAHGFFEDLLGGNRLERLEREKGRFRSYLLGALKHFLSHQRAKARAEKRGGSAKEFSLNETGAGEIASRSELPPDDWFDQQWALALLGRALTSVEESCRANGKETQFQHLSPWLTGEAEHGDQAELAERAGIPPNTLKSTIHRLRRQFRAAVKSEIVRTLEDPADVEAEMEALFAALKQS
ncbi:MAG: sigma-70 family RNA polymerase sigma factor [Verrucomicrobiales bacterium]|nr:sigma-70 family RNA polymerase sigma factor [Verrucomicrobiales bacterium]